MVQGRKDARLPFETGDPVGVRGKGLRQDFQGNVASQVDIAGAIHLAHAARTEKAQDLVRPEPGAREESQGVSITASGTTDPATRRHPLREPEILVRHRPLLGPIVEVTSISTNAWITIRISG